MTPFELAEPASLRAAIALLDPDDGNVRPMAGGTALMLMMRTGLYRPTRLVSLRRIESRYRQIESTSDGGLRIGAMAPLAALEHSEAVKQAAPVIVRALRTLSNVRVRNVATVGGHLAHADPHMDLPPVLIALDASLAIAGPGGERTLPIADLFEGYLETALAGNELIAEIAVPRAPRHTAYVKVTTRSADDWPALGIAVALEMEGGTVRSARLAIGAATERPARLGDAEAALVGTSLDDRALGRAGEAAAAETDLVGDVRGSAAYKRELLRVYLARAVRQAQAAGANGGGR